MKKRKTGEGHEKAQALLRSKGGGSVTGSDFEGGDDEGGETNFEDRVDNKLDAILSLLQGGNKSKMGVTTTWAPPYRIRQLFGRVGRFLGHFAGRREFGEFREIFGTYPGMR